MACVCLYVHFRTCICDGYYANHFCFCVTLSAFVAAIVLQIDTCVLRWHVRSVICIVVCVLCMYVCRLKVLAMHALFVSFYVSFGVLLAQLAVWQSCGVRYCVGEFISGHLCDGCFRVVFLFIIFKMF